MAGSGVTPHRLDEAASVAGQIAAVDIEQLRVLGFTAIVNNRPDDEEPGQPRGAEIEAAARAAGLAYRHIPVAGGASREQIQSMADALASAGGPLLAFCRSGTRSAYMWALARALLGDDADVLTGKAEAAGYDLRPIAGLLRSRD